MFLAAAHVLLRETLIVDENGIHRGHFGSDEWVYAVKDGRQIRKLQLLFAAGKRMFLSYMNYNEKWIRPQMLSMQIYK